MLEYIHYLYASQPMDAMIFVSLSVDSLHRYNHWRCFVLVLLVWNNRTNFSPIFFMYIIQTKYTIHTAYLFIFHKHLCILTHEYHVFGTVNTNCFEMKLWLFEGYTIYIFEYMTTKKIVNYWLFIFWIRIFISCSALWIHNQVNVFPNTFKVKN